MAILTYPLDRSFELRVYPPFELPHRLAEHVVESWEAEKKKRGDSLRNGRLYSVMAHRAAGLDLQPIEYRLVVARRNAPELAEIGLNVRPLAVTGVIRCGSSVILGHRARYLADGGLWETAPSGSVEEPDPARQLQIELEEEVGLQSTELSAPPQACGLVEDTSSGVIEIVYSLQTPLTEDAVRKRYGARASHEYQALAFVPVAEIRKFLDAKASELLPIARASLKLAGIL
jgi:hypothetical protein